MERCSDAVLTHRPGRRHKRELPGTASLAARAAGAGRGRLSVLPPSTLSPRFRAAERLPRPRRAGRPVGRGCAARPRLRPPPAGLKGEGGRAVAPPPFSPPRLRPRSQRDSLQVGAGTAAGGAGEVEGSGTGGPRGSRRGSSCGRCSSPPPPHPSRPVPPGRLSAPQVRRRLPVGAPAASPGEHPAAAGASAAQSCGVRPAAGRPARLPCEQGGPSAPGRSRRQRGRWAARTGWLGVSCGRRRWERPRVLHGRRWRRGSSLKGWIELSELMAEAPERFSAGGREEGREGNGLSSQLSAWP